MEKRLAGIEELIDKFKFTVHARRAKALEIGAKLPQSAQLVDWILEDNLVTVNLIQPRHAGFIKGLVELFEPVDTEAGYLLGL
jgi:hypothetical protein